MFRGHAAPIWLSADKSAASMCVFVCMLVEKQGDVLSFVCVCVSECAAGGGGLI